ncbi:MAG: thioredoxin fold domain-containing protein [Granulosicoccaceae bacterium]|jgi:thioredoxin-related protein
MIRRNFVVVLLFLVAQVALAAAEAPRDPYKFFFEESFGDYGEELNVAKEEGKQAILLFFEMDECPYCHYMKNTVLNQPEVQEYYRKHFKIFPVDIEGDVEITDFEGNTMKMKDFAFKKNRVRATPVFAFYDLEGKRIHRHIGKTAGVREFMILGRYIVEGAYKEQRFTKYKRAQQDKE